MLALVRGPAGQNTTVYREAAAVLPVAACAILYNNKHKKGNKVVEKMRCMTKQDVRAYLSILFVMLRQEGKRAKPVCYQSAVGLVCGRTFDPLKRNDP